MIPKVIHYCWFGGNPKSELIEKCIASWKQYCPDYEIIEWNEYNFDVNALAYTADAYAAKKWAFVSDYARLKVVYDHGGIYLDTDVLLHHSLDDTLQYNCWLASDDVRYVNTGMGFGAIKGHHLIGTIMDAYTLYSFPAGTNILRDTPVIEQELPFWKKSDQAQVLEGNILIIGIRGYGQYARHLYAYSWSDDASKQHTLISDVIKKKTFLQRFSWKLKCAVRNPSFISFFDQKKGTRIEKIYTFCAYDLLDYGPLYFVKRLIRKVFRRK